MQIDKRLEPDYIFASLIYNGVRTACNIKILEYSTLNMRESRQLTNEELIGYLRTGELHNELWKETAGFWKVWIKETQSHKVTWINIGGIDWNVIKELQTRYCGLLLSCLFIACVEY